VSGALFVYGTLMSESVMRSLTGRGFPRRRATLMGYGRGVSDIGYAFVAPRTGARVDGLLIEGLDGESLRRLDRYEDEGRLYLRRPVEVLADGARVACETYVGNLAVLRPAATA